MIHSSGLFVAPYLLRQLSRSLFFSAPHHVRFILSAIKRKPRVQSPYIRKHITVLFFAHPSALRVVQAANVVCLIKYAFVRHFRADFHVGMHQRNQIRSIRKRPLSSLCMCSMFTVAISPTLEELEAWRCVISL
jgi:hypothetical protein